jgi:hypothetical protein
LAFNESLCCELLLILSIFFYLTNVNLMSLLYAAGMYLLGASLLLFLADADI